MPTGEDIPFVYKIDIQQGNVVTQEMVAQLEPGMDKKKVRFVMGTPIVQDTFHADRWDYIYTFQPGGGNTERRRVTLVFVDEKLDHVEGDIKPALGTLVVDTRQDMTVDVPDDYNRGLFRKLKDSIPFTGGDDEAPVPDETSDQVSKSDVPEDAQPESLDVEEAQEEVLVPEDAPTKKKGLFRRLLDRIGIGADDESDKEYDTGDPKYRDPTNPDDL